jgi:hypothetical protein
VRPRRTIIRIAALVTFSLAAQAMPASAQGFFGWFGQRQDDRYPRQNSWSGSQQRENSWFGQQQERRYTPQASAYSDPTPTMQERHGPASTPSISGSTGRTVAYCVRLCDGRYFPMQQRSNATSIQLCNAFCPAAKTQVFNGTEIDRAIASNGARYANLDNAFVYRQKIVAGCTCNGKDEFGLAKIDVKSDPTLKPGDIVATGDNQKAALVAAANRQARNIVTENAALRRGKSTKASSPDTEERPED